MIFNSGYWSDWTIKSPVKQWCYWLWRLVISLVRFDPSIVKVKQSFIVSQTVSYPVGQLTNWLETINWRDTTHFDSEDDYSTGCRNVSHCQQQQFYSGIRSTGRLHSAYLWNDSWVQTFYSNKLDIISLSHFSFWLPCLFFLSFFLFVLFLFCFHKFITYNK